MLHTISLFSAIMNKYIPLLKMSERAIFIDKIVTDIVLWNQQ